MSTKLIVTNYKNFKCGVKLNEGELVNIRFQPNEMFKLEISIK